MIKKITYRYIAIAIEKGYLNSEGKNEELDTWQVAMLCERICFLAGNPKKWVLAHEIGGLKPGSYRMAQLRALDNKLEAGGFLKRLERDFN